MRYKIFPLWLAAVAGMAGQQLSFDGPRSGFLFDDRVGEIRPILGVPGAAYLGDAVLAGLAWASVAPNAAVALGVRDDALYAVAGLDRLNPELQPIANATVLPDRAAWSAEGSVAVVYVSGSGWAQVIRDFASRPVASEPIFLGPDVTALAVDAQGRVVAGREDGLYFAAPDELRRLPVPAVRVASLAISASKLWLAAADGQVLEIQDYAAQPRIAALDQLGDPVGLAVAPDGSALYAADRASRAILVYDLVRRVPAARLELEVDPAMLEPLSGGSIFLVRKPVVPTDPLWVFKAQPEPGIWFVPARRGE